MPGQLERITDVAPTLYIHEQSRRPIENIEQIQEDLWTWWAEADLRPSPIRLSISDNKLRDKYGNDLALQARAAAVIRKGRVEQERVEAEVAGVERLNELLTQGSDVIYLSPPGSEDEGFGAEGRRRLSFTYLYIRGNGDRVHFLAVPELEMPVQDHFGRVADLVERSGNEGVEERSLVSHPFIALDRKSFDLLAQRMGYKNLLDMWKISLEAKRTRGRAGELIRHASQQIWDAKKEGNNTKLEVLGDVFRGVVALLVSGGLVDVDSVDDYFDKNVQAMFGAKELDIFGGSSHVLYLPYIEQMQEFYLRMQNNSKAMEIMQGGSCPGDRGLGFGENLWDKPKDVAVTNNVLMDVLGDKEEVYSFDHDGQCVICKVDPKKLGPCGICEDCDHKIRVQAGQ